MLIVLCQLETLNLYSNLKTKLPEAFFITLRKPALNDQLEHDSLSLFRHGIN